MQIKKCPAGKYFSIENVVNRIEIQNFALFLNLVL